MQVLANLARLDWGAGNPNKTAALLVGLLILLWILPLIKKRLLIITLPAWGLLSWYLVATESRGGQVALMIGMVPIMVCFAVNLKRTMLLLACASLLMTWTMVGIAGKEQRYKKILAGDDSINNRFLLWSAAPQMMASAPLGWGLGNSGKVFEEWYQPVDRNEKYRTLVNSHLTWMVELGWLGSLAYLWAWSAILLLSLPATKAVHAVSGGIWLGLGIAASFSSVAEYVWAWPIPLSAFLAVIIYRSRHREWPTSRQWTFWMGSATLIFLCLIAAGSVKNEIHKGSHGIAIGKKGAHTVIDISDEEVFGSQPGRVWRKSLGDKAFGLASSVIFTQDFKNQVHYPGSIAVVVGGTITEEEVGMTHNLEAQGNKLIFLNPKFSPKILSKEDKNRRVYLGEYANNPWRFLWLQEKNATSVSGTGDFFEDWPVFAIEHLSESGN